jgi:eukaryotic-like serine/threonine-protein kinase
MGEAASAISSATWPLPRMLGQRMLVKLVARGGMGDVYLGATTGLEGAERPCIIKTVRRDHIRDGSFLARFLDEARVQAQLQHPGVAQVLDAATDENGEPFTVVEYVEGRALSDVRQRAIQTGVKIGWADAVSIAIEMAQALAHVHERAGADGAPLGIVHRDLSPQNVMVGYAGEIKLIDFGTARGHNRRCRTVAGVVFAKPGYVAPEVARQQIGDGRIDIYGLGIVLWELCAGRRFLTTDPQRHLDEAAAGRVVVPPIAAECHAPEALDDVLAKLTSNDPDQRYARASLAAFDLAWILSQATASQPGERGVRNRIALLMRKLWPHEPARSRAEFARLVRESRQALFSAACAASTPSAGPVSEGMAARMTSDPAQLCGTPYRLGRKIGEGASGTVYEAEHVDLGRNVALKILHAGSASAPEPMERFRREARAVASLSHPNLVQLYDFGKSFDGRGYLAMELCPGETLDARLRAGPMGWRLAAHIAIETAKALAAAHAAGLVHRDLKPHNLMLIDSEPRPEAPSVKLLDFGIATVLTPDRRPPTDKERALRGFVVHGTPEYMAPEQVTGDTVDGRADLYALGCVLYEMLTGVRAFDGPSSVVVMGKQLRETPLPPRALQASRSVPRALETVVVKAMAKDPGDRYESADAMRSALEEVFRAPLRRRDRFKTVATAVLSCVAMLAGGLAAARWERSHGPAPEVGLVGIGMGAGPGTSAFVEEPPAPGLGSMPREREPVEALASSPGSALAIRAAKAEPLKNSARARRSSLLSP